MPAFPLLKKKSISCSCFILSNEFNFKKREKGIDIVCRIITGVGKRENVRLSDGFSLQCYAVHIDFFEKRPVYSPVPVLP